MLLRDPLVGIQALIEHLLALWLSERLLDRGLAHALATCLEVIATDHAFGGLLIVVIFTMFQIEYT